MADKSADNSGFQEASILNASVSDQTTAEDELGFKPYVEAIAEFLINPVTQPPLTISIEGEWGSGKSSFMKQLQKTIEEFQYRKIEKELQDNLGNLQVKLEIGIRKIKSKNYLHPVIIELFAFIFKNSLSFLINIYKWTRLHLNKLQPKPKTIWFNAWKHDKAEALWAAFALEFLRQISIGSNITLFRLRFDWKNGFLFIFFFFISFINFAKQLVAVVQRGSNLWQSKYKILQIIIQPSFNNLLRWDVLIILLGFIGLIYGCWKLSKNDPKKELAKYLKTPDYEKQVAFIEKFHEDFKKIVQAYAGKSKVYVFIDDLDRCEVPKSAELMQAINMMIANDPQLIFILGMDREKVAAGIAVKDKDLIPYLSDNADYQNTSISHKKGLEYGYGFLEKFIQIPFQVPQPTQSEFQRFLVKISQPQKKTYSFWYSYRRSIIKSLKYIFQLRNKQPQNKPEPNTLRQEIQRTSTPKQKILNRREQLKIAVTEDSHNVRDIILMVAPVLDYNPRRLKQFINLFRLKNYIASNTGSFDELTDESTTVSYKPLTLEQLGKFTAISLKFPRLIIDLNTDRQLLKNLQHGALKKPADFSSYNETTKYWGEYQKLVELLRSPALWITDTREFVPLDDKYSLAEVDVDKLLQVSPGTQDDLSSERGIDYTKLRDYLKYQQWKKAEWQTYLVMLQAVGRVEGEWLTSEELLNFPCIDLHTINHLWLKYSDGKFGFSVQKEIYLSVGGKLDGSYNEEVWKKFGDRVGWRVNGNWILDSLPVTYDTSAPMGLLPLPYRHIANVSRKTFGDVYIGNGDLFSLLSHREL
jgi:hypothetical protein